MLYHLLYPLHTTLSVFNVFRYITFRTIYAGLTALMISKRIADTAVPMSLLGDHPNVRFSFLRSGIGTCSVDMH